MQDSPEGINAAAVTCSAANLQITFITVFMVIYLCKISVNRGAEALN